MTRNILALIFLAAVLPGCDSSRAQNDVSPHVREVMEWRQQRLDDLLAPTGYLTQVGLFWIREGSYSIGSSADSDIRLPATAAAHVGNIAVDENTPVLSVAEGVEVLTAAQDGAALSVREMVLPPDTSGETIIVFHGSIAWSFIERGGKLAVRVRDFEHPWVKSFGPIPYYDIDSKWRIDAILHRYDEPREIVVDTVIEGFQQFPVAPGVVVRFTIDGTEYELEPQLVDGRLFFVFGDLTNRGETYGAGRYLYADMAECSDKVVLDFNKSYSPPCAFNDFSTCPIASPRNRVRVRIDAGEKYDESLHFAGES